MDIISLRFIAGLTLIALNYPIGWAGLIAGAFLYRKTRRRWWCLAGTGVYGSSWCLLAAGIYLAGPEGLSYVRGSGWPFYLAATCAVVTGCVVILFMRRRGIILSSETYPGPTSRIDNTAVKKIKLTAFDNDIIYRKTI